MNMPSDEGERGAPLSLPRYAEALAFAQEYPLTDRAAVLARLGVAPAELAAAGAYWSRRIAEALANNEAGPVVQLARAYGVAERYARLERPPIGRLKSRVKDEVRAVRELRVRERVPLPEKAVMAVAPPPLDAVAERLLPSYLRAEARPMSAGAGGDVEATAQIDTRHVADLLRERNILPFDRNAPAMPPPPSAPQEQSGETQLIKALDLDAVLGTRKSELAAAPALPIPIARFANIQAALSKSRDREGVLRHFGFEPHAWQGVEAAISATLGASESLRNLYEDLYRRAVEG